MNQSIATAARKAGEKCKVPVIGIVTDVPGACVGNVNKDSSRNPVSAFISKYSKESMLNYDGYLLLTKAMNELVNPHNKPYVVIEGHSDIGMSTSENLIENKSSPNVIMYAGGVSKVYGIEMLVNAFKKINPDNWELHIYGKGDYDKELSERSKTEDKIKFGGLLPNSEIVDKQIKAALLVNPRPTDKEYVKYSFPSKTLECMVSGTPLITTALPGMPKEYNDYVYIFDKETEDGFADTLKKVMSLDKEEIHSKGISAKEFALKEKNNVTQAKKFTEFLVDICIK
ncbi:MAG: glycosyltransferase [Clostridia bacterium]|nr:glycosyltransferase [Clostridia bacterium]